MDHPCLSNILRQEVIWLNCINRYHLVIKRHMRYMWKNPWMLNHMPLRCIKGIWDTCSKIILRTMKRLGSVYIGKWEIDKLQISQLYLKLWWFHIAFRREILIVVSKIVAVLSLVLLLHFQLLSPFLRNASKITYGWNL